LRRLKILIVDDDPDLRTTVEMRFSAAGFEVQQAGSGEEGLELASRLRPAAIILDVNMPGLDGFETCRRLRAGRRTRDIPVIMLTACKRVGELEEGLEAGADTYITKPFDGRELVAEVREIVTGKRKKKESTRRIRKTGLAAAEQVAARLKAAPRRLGEVARAVPGVLLGRRDSRLLSDVRATPEHRPILFEDDIQPFAARAPGKYFKFSPEVARAMAPDPSVFDAPKKVLVKRTAPPLVAALGSDQRLADKAVICVVPRGTQVKAEFILGVLASRVGTFAFEQAIERVRAGVLPWISPAEIERLPLPGLGGTAGRDYEDNVASAAAELVRRARLGPGGLSGPAQKLREKLDKLVAKGFGIGADALKNLVS